MSAKIPSDLGGEELSAVSFVRDYVELHFDGPVLRALTLPVVVDAAGRSTDATSDVWRNALCALIGVVVVGVEIDDGVAIRVRFAGGTRLEIPLSDKFRRGPEAAHFLPEGDLPMFVW